MRISLHLGAHRTGTSALMAALMANSGPLKSAALSYWGPEELRKGLGAGLVRKPELVTLPEEKRGRRAVGRMQLRQAQLERGGVERLLVIGPDLIGRPDDCLDQATMYPQLVERLARAIPAFSQRCDRVTLAIRRPDRWWASLLAVSVARGRAVPSAGALDCLVTHPRRWRHIIREVASVFPQATLTVWPAEVLSDLPERQIAALTGNPNKPLLTPYRARPDRAPDAETLEDLLMEQGRPAHLSRGSAGQWQPFNDLQLAAFHEQYQEDLAWLSAGGEGCATAIGLEGADLSPSGAYLSRQQGADFYDSSKKPRRMG